MLLDKYLPLVLESAELDKQGAITGQVQKQITRKSLSPVRITLPPLHEQRRIVDLMDSVDTAVDAAQAEVEALTGVRDRCLDLELNNPHESWTASTLGDVAEWFSGATPKATDRSLYEGGSIPWAKIGDVKNQPISDTEVKINSAGLAKIGRLAPVGSVLLSMYGSIGRSALVKREMATNQAIAWAVPRECISSEFLFLSVKKSEKELDQLGRGATQRNINRVIIRGFPINLPPLAEQERIVETMNRINDAITAATAALDRLRDLRSSLLTCLLSGQHEIPESYDRFL